MVRVVHSLKEDEINKNVRKTPTFLLTNKLGGFAYLSDKPQSRFQGLFFNKNFEIYKTLESLELKPELTKIYNKFYEVTTKREKITETFFMPLHHNSLFYEIKNYKGNLIINLDCKKIYDDDILGRKYNITYENNKVIIEYEKENSYKICLIISSDKQIFFEKIGEWKKRNYKLHTSEDPISERYIYSAIKLKIRSDQLFNFTFALDKNEALKKAESTLKNVKLLKKERKSSLFYSNLIQNNELRMAYNAAQNSLRNLLVEVNEKIGLNAGLPWFFHFWIRDEMISLKALGKTREVKKILESVEKSITREGKIPNRIPPFGTAADSIGWYYKRRGRDKKLGVVIKALLKNSTRDDFAINNIRETWMDSLERGGARIEIQALRLNMYKLGGEKDLEKKLKQKVKEKFWNGKILADGLNDFTIRPNIFLAAYAYPELLTKQEWTTCFKNALPKLWNAWGSLSTLDKKSPHYIKTISKEGYHNGNSWFYLNNLAALTLHKVRGFEKYVNKILKASTEEILWLGMVGHHSEISSSNCLESAGCGCQAWSNAMFIELVNELTKRHQ